MNVSYRQFLNGATPCPYSLVPHAAFPAPFLGLHLVSHILVNKKIIRFCPTSTWPFVETGFSAVLGS